MLKDAQSKSNKNDDNRYHRYSYKDAWDIISQKNDDDKCASCDNRCECTYDTEKSCLFENYRFYKKKED